MIINDEVDIHRNATTNHMVSTHTVVYIQVCMFKINVTSSVISIQFLCLTVHSYTKEVHVNVHVHKCTCTIIINIVVETSDGTIILSTEN